MAVNMTAQTLDAVGSVAGEGGLWRSDDLTGVESFGDPLISTDLYYGATCISRGIANGGGTACQTLKGSNDPLINWEWDDGNQSLSTTESTSQAASPNGSNTGGARFYVGDGVNSQSGQLIIDFGSFKPELWIRYYMRYQAGFVWSGGGQPAYDKNLYIWRQFGVDGMSINPQYHGSATGGGNWTLAILGETYPVVASPALSWTDVFGNPADGHFHLFEVYLKMDTDSTDGIGKMWIDGQKVMESNTVDWSGGNATFRTGWKEIEFEANQDSPNNGGERYVDYTDLEIWDSTPPNVDANGDPWIGPVNGFIGGA